MKLKDRRSFQVIDRIRDVLLDSDRDIGVLINEDVFHEITHEFSDEEVNYALRYLRQKEFLAYYHKDMGGYTLTAKGYDEWLFPNGLTDKNSVFISYAQEDKSFAGRLKKALEEVGFRAFLAHEDIEPTARWRDKIISDLKTSSTFISLRTINYIKKQYTEQECGFALALNKRILSICVNTEASDMGFLSEFQAANFKENEEDKIIEYCLKQLK